VIGLLQGEDSDARLRSGFLAFGSVWLSAAHVAAQEVGLYVEECQ
jgi:hypothetical protein